MFWGILQQLLTCAGFECGNNAVIRKVSDSGYICFHRLPADKKLKLKRIKILSMPKNKSSKKASIRML